MQRIDWQTLLEVDRPFPASLMQIVCSAIGNAPPPDGLVKVLHLMGRAGFTNKQTRNKMCKLFDGVGGKHRMLNRRNWCEVRAGLVRSGHLL